MLSSLRRPSLVLTSAFFFACIGAVDTSYAQDSFQNLVAIPDTIQTLPGDTTANQPLNPGSADTADGPSLELDGVISVDAKDIALVSLAARQVQLAKTPAGARLVAKDLIDSTYGWNSTQVSCLNQLWTGESHWNFKAHNYRSGAHGIPQALPATKMEIVSTDWRTNPVTQIKWGLSYIKARYKTPCVALKKKHRSHYY